MPAPVVTKRPWQQLVPAEAMLAAVDHDLQFVAPSRPRLVAGLAPIPIAGGLILEGTAERQVLKGGTATDVVPRLLPALDGTASAAELAERLGLQLPLVRATLATLYMSGVVEEGADGPQQEPVPPALAFLGRHLDTTRVNRSTAELALRLAAARVAVVAPPPADALLRAQLEACEIETVDAVADATAAIGIAAGAADAVAALDEECGARGLPWLHVGIGDGRVVIGPFLDRRCSPCYRCAARAWEDELRGSPDPHALELELALAATQAVYAVARVGHGGHAAIAQLYDLDSWRQQRVVAARRIGCPVCCPFDGEAGPGAAAAYRFEQSVEFPPKDRVDPKNHQHHYRLANIALQKRRKRYTSARTIRLPRQRDPEPQPGRLGVEQLAVLLARTFGVNPHVASPPGKVKLWAPTGGNLGSPQAYLLALDVDGLEPGHYYYEPFAEELAVLSRPEAELAVEPAVDDPAAVLVVAGALGRVAKKYFDFAYKVCLLDAGVAVGQLATVADALGLRAVPAVDWADDAVLDAFGLDGLAEPIAAVVSLAHGAPGP